MCSPKVAQVVNERIEKEGLPKVSRRNFLRFGGALTAGLAVAPSVALARPSRFSMHGHVVDLSHSLSTDFPVFPGFNHAERLSLVTVEENGFYAQQWTFGEHTSTHMDFPGHFIADGALVDELPADILVGPAVVIDIAARAEDDPDTVVTVEDLRAWESEHGEIPEGAFVLMYSGWESKANDEATYRGSDADGGLHFPGFSGESAEFLVNERSINGVGVDTLSIDHGPSATFDVHYTILGAGLLGIENLANLAMLKGAHATIVCGVPKYQEGSGGPARILALAEDSM